MAVFAVLTYGGNEVNFALQGLPGGVANRIQSFLGFHSSWSVFNYNVLVLQQDLVVIYRLRFNISQMPFWVNRILRQRFAG